MSKTFTIRLPDELFEQAAQHAEKTNSTVADLVRSGLAEKISGVSLVGLDTKLDAQNAKLDKIIQMAEAE